MDKEYNYLNILNKKLDDRQHNVCCFDKNAVVAAGAGSGKTQVLATRFAWLVMSQHIKASKILTLTFTKKAAGEMYQRIYETLLTFAESDETPAEEKEYAKKALEDFGEVHIQTLDSYCSSIVKQSANIYGIRPDFTTGSQDSEVQVKEAALTYLITHSDDKCLENFVAPGDIQNFSSDVLAKAINEYATIADDDNFFTSGYDKQIAKAVDDFNYFVFEEGTKPEDVVNAFSLSELCKSITSTKTYQTEYNKPASKPEKQIYQDYVKDILADIEGFVSTVDAVTIEDVKSCTPHLKEVVEKVEGIIDKINKIPGKGYSNDVRSCFTKAKDKDTGVLNYISSASSFFNTLQPIHQLMELFDKFHTQVKRSKCISGNLSFRDVQKMALKILKEQQSIRQQEKDAYDRIMIDEFQDNNDENRQLLFLLSEKKELFTSDPTVNDIMDNKLFFVGDEKQSIYKFRGADVSVFNKLKTDFQDSFGKESLLQMEYNYRSTPELIKTFNMFFGKPSDGIFSSRQNNKPFEAKYEVDVKKFDPQSKQVVQLPEITADNTAMHVCLFDENYLKKNDEQLPEDRKDFYDKKNQIAYFIVDRIKKMYDAETDSSKKKYSNFAILDKSRTDRYLIIKWLNMFNIPYVLDQSSKLFDAGPVFDIYNFLRICVYPSDENAFAAYLASPLGGLTVEEVQLVLACLVPPDNKSFNCSLAATSSGEDVAELIKKSLGERYSVYEKAVDFYKTTKSKVLSSPLTSSIEYLWNTTGYYYETLLNNNTLMTAEQFDLLYEVARGCDESDKGVAWFVDQLAVIKTNEASTFGDDQDLNTKDVSYPVEKEDGVQIMTIHKSKGLQFENVFVMGCINSRGGSDKNQYFFDSNLGYSLKNISDKANYFFTRQKNYSSEKEVAEFRRLIYVAITRAIKSVYLMGIIDTSAKEFKAELDSFRMIDHRINCDYPGSMMTYQNIPADGMSHFNDGTCYDIFMINPVTRDEIKALNLNQISSLEESRKNIREIFDEVYSQENNIKLENERISKITPALMEVEDDSKVIATDKKDKYENIINPIINNQKDSSTNKERITDADGNELVTSDFTYADFGTLAHSYLEMNAKDVDAVSFNPETRVFKTLEDKDIEIIKDVCVKMCYNFNSSDVGKTFAANKKRGDFFKSEWRFKTCIDDFLVTGSLDLISRNADGTYTIVDYKTDGKINPSIYYKQQSLYRTAASRLLKVPRDQIKCSLYFLRYDEEVDITKETDAELTSEEIISVLNEKKC